MINTEYKRPLIPNIVCIVAMIFGIIGFVLSLSVNDIKQTGEKVEAYIVESDKGSSSNSATHRSPYTRIKVVDKNSPYYERECASSKYSAFAAEGEIVEVYYNGNDFTLPGEETFLIVLQFFGAVGVISLISNGIQSLQRRRNDVE